ncbi:FG-GAP-like repeat-containing protein [Halalkalibaculum sp. DA3122]|uniref:FG-GAP-like repeat-containing protein n=1 Tax=Halalkalibaculum sp. DA3122 TaxID=3373607 RepID=UPI0037545D7B
MKIINAIIFITSLSLLIGCSHSAPEESGQKAAGGDGKGYRFEELTPAEEGQPGFRQLSSSDTNIDFTNRLTLEEIGENRHLMNGSGVAAGDIDGDGLVDLYFSALNGPNRLYKNMGGMEFRDITDQAGVAHEGYYSTGAVFADVNGDGHLDLLVTCFSKENALYINDGNGQFHRREDTALGEANGSTTMALADITGNGYLDLYIAKYKEKSVYDLYSSNQIEWNNILTEPLGNLSKKYELAPPFDQHFKIHYEDGKVAGRYEIGEVDELYLNEGGEFEKVSDTDLEEMFLDQNGNFLGLQPDWGLTARFQDLDGDGLIDLYICNDFEAPDRLWMNQGNGRFKLIDWQKIRSLSNFSMAVDFSDINRDGYQDIFISEMLSTKHSKRLTQAGPEDPDEIPIGDIESRPVYNRNSLLLQRRDHTYAQIAYYSNTEATDWSWATRFLDIDLDGYEDLLIATGYLWDALDIDAQIALHESGQNIMDHYVEFMKKAPELKQPNRVLRNDGDLTFTDKTEDWAIGEEDVSQGMALADLDNDGDQDAIINRLNSPSVIYENVSSAPRIAVRLNGNPPNTQAIGARVELLGGPVPAQEEQLSAGGDYLSHSEPMAMFAAAPDSNHTIRVSWPGGGQTVIDSVKANRVYEIDESSKQNVSNEKTEERESSQSPVFREQSAYISHSHHEDTFPDFNLQALMPTRLSQLGPGIAWLDINRDGRDDLLIASGKGGRMAVFQNSGDGSFDTVELGPATQTAPGDQTAIIGWRQGDQTKLVVGSSNLEQKGPEHPSAYIYTIDENGLVQSSAIPGVHSTTGPLAAADINEDGYPDLFVGGRLKPGIYPQSASSRLFINEGDSFRLDEQNSGLFENIGNVTGAVFADVTQNGRQDLLLSTEWGPLLLFKNNGGRFEEVTAEYGLDQYRGWWNGVAVGDFTNNGQPDIAAANIGENSVYQMELGQPLRMYYEDFNRDGRVDIIDSYANQQGDYVPRKKLLTYQQQELPFYKTTSHETFANATLDEILGGRLDDVPYKQINTLRSMVFINDGNSFEAKPLPPRAQFSMGFHPAVADFNNDGNEDLFLSQNFFAFPPQVSRLDAGRGLLLEGDGSGNFKPVAGSKSGIKVYGEQRGAGFADYNADGKVDLVVAQNGAQTKLYRNQAENRGYRVTLKGPDRNRDAVGSSLRLVYENGEKGPRRYVQSGAGYWSQGSFIQVLGAGSTGAAEIEIRWFDGTTQTVDLEDGKWDYAIDYPK